MKHEKWYTCLQSIILAFLLSFSGIACLVSGFDLAAQLPTAALWCLLAAIVCSLCFTVKFGFLPPCIAAVTLGYLWQIGKLASSAEFLLKSVLWQYERVHGWGILSVNDFVMGTQAANALGPTLFLCLWGALTAMAVAWAVCRGKTVIPSVVMGLLPLTACLIIDSTPPESLWFYLLLLGVVLMLLTCTVRKKDAHQGNRLGTLAVLPAALVLLVLFYLVPQNEQENNFVDTIVDSNTVQTFWDKLTGNEPVTDANGVDLTAVGAQTQSTAQILQVTADYDAILYLRSRAMDSYDGVSWTSSGTSTDALYWPTELERAGSVTVSTRFAHRMLYLPYYVNSMDLTDITVGVENSRLLTQYTFSCSAVPKQAYLAQLEQTEQDLSQYLHLDESVCKWAQPLAQQLTGQADTVWQKANAIAAYVRNSAVYDTHTQAMPKYKKDFVRWFLDSADTGYCVHFASSAAVLLQAAGIPARYVTGYMVQAKAGEKTVVNGTMAHAWVEYWLPGFGWTVLEATPSASEQAVVLPSDEQLPHTETARSPLTVLLLVAAVLTLFGIAELQRYFRRLVRVKRRSRMDVNAQAVSLWQEAAQLSRLLGCTPDPQLFHLTQRAKFSQHTLDAAQLQDFEVYICAARQQLKKKNLFKRMYYRLILAAY